MKEIKDKIAQEKGYPNWDAFYNWVAREGEYPSVVAQQIESAMADVQQEFDKQRVYSYDKYIVPFAKRTGFLKGCVVGSCVIAMAVIILKIFI